ncbi:MAG TPA: alpha/beta hydrolase [Armatimonadota bacterium]
MTSADWIIRDIGAPRTLVLLPGWATDARIFASLNIAYNIITPKVRSSAASPEWNEGEGASLLSRESRITRLPQTTGTRRYYKPDSLASLLQELATPVTLCGWSLGGFAAADFARQYPELVSKLILIGVRRRFPPELIAARRQALREDRPRCLSDFYRQCFLPAQRSDFRRFRAELELAYLQDFSTDDLEAGLDYLASVELSAEALSACPTVLVHGEQDVIAPISEARELAAVRPPIPDPFPPRGKGVERNVVKSTPSPLAPRGERGWGIGGRQPERAESGNTNITLHVLPNAGHAAFLHPEFQTILHDA